MLTDRPWWQDILLPPTDRAIVVEGVMLTVLSIASITLSWRWSSVRLVVVGCLLILWALFGLRAAH